MDLNTIEMLSYLIKKNPIQLRIGFLYISEMILFNWQNALI